MNRNNRAGTLERVVREILRVAREAEGARAGALRDIEGDFRSIVGRDYGGSLSRHFSRRELRDLIGALTASLPNLNREQITLIPAPGLARIAARLGAEFKANPFNGPAGLSLRGFYVDSENLKQPLICVNSAHHPLAVNSAFWHEVGHHLTAGLSPRQREMGQELTARLLHGKEEEFPGLSFGSDYHEHLNDPMELAADMLVSLVAYSRCVAKQLFGPLLQRGTAENIHEVLSAARAHLDSVWGFTFDKQIGAAENLHYLAGMIHFAKLRLALLAEYDI
jgi:hypothetical protein